MIYFFTNRAGDFSIRDFVELHAPALAAELSVMHYEDLPARTSLPAGTYIFSALDQLSEGGHRLVAELAEQLERNESAGSVINHPARAMLRFALLQMLHRNGLNTHAAFKASGHLKQPRFPAFLREEFQHNGAISPLLFDQLELERALGSAVLRGYRIDELLVVEFCETAAADGRYRRYSAFVVGSRIIARELMVGSEWMLKAQGNKPTEEDLLEERAYVLGNPHEQELRAIFDLAGVEYGRIDYAVRDGRIVTWEINLNPTIRRGRVPDATPLPAALDALREPVRRHFTSTFVEALRALDRSRATASTPIRYSEGCLRNATPMIRVVSRRRSLMKILRPAAPFVNRGLRVLSPLVARAARRFSGERRPR